MKILITFINGERMVVDDAAMILPYPASQIVTRVELQDIPDELEKLIQDPYNEDLVAKLAKKT